MPYRQPHPPSSTTRGVRVGWRFDPNPYIFSVLGPWLGTFLLGPAIHVIARAPIHETWGTVALTLGFVAYLMIVGLLVGLKHRLVPIEAPTSVPVLIPAPRLIALKDLVKAFQDEISIDPSE